MRRREFIQNTLGSVAMLAAAKMSSSLALAGEVSSSPTNTPVSPESENSTSPKLRGVNLGAWLVLEKWMTPDTYSGTDAEDEYTLCLDLGDKAKDRLNRHRDTFITADDFQWIKKSGLNAVRLPVGYWALEAPKPYVECSSYIDFALDQCQQNDLKLLLDLHGAPGSQNGWDHSGRMGPINWPKDPQNVQETLRVIESFAQKYGGHPALYGIELLNEPRPEVPLDILQQYYIDGYARVRKHANPNVVVVIHDSFRPLAWKNFMRQPEFNNVVLDTHLYQCFDKAAKSRTALEQLTFSLNRKTALDEMQQQELPTLVGEWSLSLPYKAMSGLSSVQKESTTRGYAGTQLLNYEATRGWFFWSYKLQDNSDWHFRHCVERGWLPSNFDA
ncbi:MAG TPA: glycoside hydrolase family 5 protein [Pseudomonadales bacterium]|nr:glycoside hydrolase family 5 protein [Pseudomonadales bacterium]